MGNIAFIDGQNLYLATRCCGWGINHKKFRTYLKDKYKVDNAYYFIGYVHETNQVLYNDLQKAGFILQFKEHHSLMQSKKKGNIDVDLVFEVMKNLLDESESFEKIFLISSDGDYKKIVDYLIKKQRFGKILFPTRENTSSLYKSLGSEFFDFLDNPAIKRRIEYIKERGS